MATHPERGRVIQSVGGFHSVALPGGAELLRARGRLKRKGGIVAGDIVEVGGETGERVVERVLPRANVLVRPAVANVDLIAAVASVADPSPAYDLTDRILLTAERARIDALIVLNKSDFERPDDGRMQAYSAAGYPVFATSAANGVGIEALGSELSGRVTVLAGPSGVGKSSLVNALVDPDLRQSTREVSEKTKRGRHTTREVSLLQLRGGGWIADTPGFSTLSLADLDPRELPDLYPEYRALGVDCRFSGCLHRREPGCAVLAALERGELDSDRYGRYLRMLEETEDAFERRY